MPSGDYVYTPPLAVASGGPACVLIGLTVLVAAAIGWRPQTHAFGVLGLPEAPAAALRWQAWMAIAWVPAAIPVLGMRSLLRRGGWLVIGLIVLLLGISYGAAWLA